MISEKMKKLAENNSVIRAMFEEGNQMAREFGRENVYDFSILGVTCMSCLFCISSVDQLELSR